MTQDEFHFSLTADEKKYLKELVFLSIESKLTGTGPEAPPDPPTKKLREMLGAFVTLKTRGRLRGCIGNVHALSPVFETVWSMARSAAFQDPRFPPLSEAEFKDLEVEISILSPLTKCEDPEKIEIGRHGLVVQKGANAGLLLPQVAVEWKWDRKTFLDQTCAKAGLAPGCWREPGTELIWFEAEVFQQA